MEGRDRELKESVIGVEVFGREAGYDPKRDLIVRTEARRLRVRLGEYYANSGKHDAVVIELPKGGYVPNVCAAPAEADRLKATPRLLSPKLGIGLLVLTLGILGWARLGPGGRPRSNPNAEASGLYLRARAFEALPGLRGIEDSIDLFQQALARDPAFAPAYAGIAAGQAARSALIGSQWPSAQT
jgi:hypothetical protein